jgi:pyruvate/2-oxoglutarate dehydrogenase complex dihydrolipoamide acyltransferase (E2) component
MPKAPPKEHPKPYRSPLRRHLQIILSMRRHKRMSWSEIARHLKTEHGIDVDRSTVFRIYKRARAGRDPFSPEAKPKAAASKLAVMALAGEPASSAKGKHTRKACGVKRGITAEELLKPVSKVNAGPFAKWHEQWAEHYKNAK